MITIRPAQLDRQLHRFAVNELLQFALTVICQRIYFLVLPKNSSFASCQDTNRSTSNEAFI